MDTPKEETDDVALSERLLDLFVFLPTGLVVTVAEELPRLAVRGRERLGVQVNSARAIGEFVVVASQDELKRRVGRIRPHGRPADSEQGNPVPRDETPFDAPPRLRRIPRPPVADVPAPERTPGNATASGPASGPGTGTGSGPASGPGPGTATVPAPRHAPANSFATGVGSANGVGSATGVGSAPTARSALFDRPATTSTQTQTQTQTTTQTTTAPTVASGPSSSRPIRAAGGHIPDVSSLAIPGFDTLSASQVVHRLDGLSRSELVATRAYELATRGRRTILSRVDQLLDERS